MDGPSPRLPTLRILGQHWRECGGMVCGRVDAKTREMQCLGSAGGWRHLLRSCAYLPCAQHCHSGWQLGQRTENLWIQLDCDDGQIFVAM